jgi:putative ABC transport system ATP-binding protein
VGDALEPLFAFDGVVVELGGRRVLDGITLDVLGAGVTVLLGPSGSGKSTLLRLCNRLEVPTEGEVRFRGMPLDQLDPLWLRRHVGMVFQRPTPFPGTVRDNLLVADPDGDDERFARALERADLPRHYLDRVADELSGGESQRACLARTLVAEPEVLLMDEVTSSLDTESTRALEALACGYACDAERPVPVIWVTHDLAQADRIADRRVVLANGKVQAHA